MSEFTVTNEIAFPLAGTDGRWWHLATIHYNSPKPEEFMYFEDRLTGQRYVEEISGGQLLKIEDDSLWKALTNFLEEKGFTTIFRK